jgi:hypothetical protein
VKEKDSVYIQESCVHCASPGVSAPVTVRLRYHPVHVTLFVAI